MAKFVIKHNLSTPDLQSYYCSLWSGDHSSFSSSQARGWLTDMELVARECVGDTEIGWGSVMVHRAVILPLCPQLAKLTQLDEGRQEDPKIIFSEVPLEVIKSFVQLIYTGSCFLSEVADVKNILELMGSFGIIIQSHKFEVVNWAAADASTSLIKRMVNTDANDFVSIKDRTGRLNFDENVSEQIDSLMNDTIEQVASVAQSHILGVEESVKEASSKDVNCNSRSTVKSKSKEPRFSCDHCEFQCRFWNRLVEHADIVHTDRKFSCDKCAFQTSKLVNVKLHKNHVHVGKGSFQCDKCGFKALNPGKLVWHQKFQHKKSDGGSTEIKEKFSCDKCAFKASKMANVKSHIKKFHIGEGSYECGDCGLKATNPKKLKLHQKRYHQKSKGLVMRRSRKQKKSESLSLDEAATTTRVRQRVQTPEETFCCHLCDFNTMFKKSLERHVRRFHEDTC